MSVYDQLMSQSDRKCRSETLLRLLIATSYPQSVLTRLTFDFYNHANIKDPESLEEIAMNLRDVEKNFDMNDFIRCIELKRDGDQVTITIKRLDFDPTMRSIVDGAETHEVMASTTVTLPAPDTVLTGIDSLGTSLLEMFYRSQVKSRKDSNNLCETVWKSRVKHLDRRRLKQEAKVVDSELDFKGALEMLSSSLRKRRFHIVLTQDTVLLLDQKSRLWGVRKA